MAIKHSAVADGTFSATGAINWDADHTLEDATVTYAKIQDVSVTDRVLGRSTVGAGDVEEIPCTSAGRAILDDADAAAQRTTLGLGTIATQSAANVAITGGTVSGITDLVVADGGTGASAFTAFAVMCGGITGTAAVQSIAGVGTAAQVLTSNGAGALPTFQAASGGLTAATQAEMEAASSTTVGATPGRQHFHPSSIKAAVRFNVAGTIAYNYNITSITDNGTGSWNVVIATDFSGASSYAAAALIGARAGGNPLIINVRNVAAAGQFDIQAMNIAEALADAATPDEIHVMFTGDFA